MTLIFQATIAGNSVREVLDGGEHTLFLIVNTGSVQLELAYRFEATASNALFGNDPAKLVETPLPQGQQIILNARTLTLENKQPGVGSFEIHSI